MSPSVVISQLPDHQCLDILGSRLPPRGFNLEPTGFSASRCNATLLPRFPGHV